MNIITPSVEMTEHFGPGEAIEFLEECGRTCYKSSSPMTYDSACKFCKSVIERDHGSVLEHVSATFRVICDRGVSHEFVRHRHISFSQESTRYCNYTKDKFGNELTFIRPRYFTEDSDLYAMWKRSCELCEAHYTYMIAKGATPQQARSVLNNSLKTEVVATANFREWRHFCKLRCSPAAHPDMKAIADMILLCLHSAYPVIFEDIYQEVFKNADDIAKYEKQDSAPYISKRRCN